MVGSLAGMAAVTLWFVNMVPLLLIHSIFIAVLSLI